MDLLLFALLRLEPSSPRWFGFKPQSLSSNVHRFNKRLQDAPNHPSVCHPGRRMFRSSHSHSPSRIIKLGHDQP
ncbi:unnamed protein product [Rhizoctonia solani]|uniref:Uncharacterized protein n=1 Tax=Rhizoctonia solani TaxID=456999 RepID=A0A8H3E1G6_9AGAM|nr:unnamed protein product [Rhizoctonia solani]